MSTDTRFRSAARLLASYWREDQNIPIGAHVTDEPKPKHIKLGSLLSLDAARAGLNFINTDVFNLVRHSLMLREEGAMIDENRLYSNALSSMPLCFNLLGPMALDTTLATKVFAALLPGFVRTVVSIDFETSPGRRDARFLNDGTALDAALQVITPDGVSNRFQSPPLFRVQSRPPLRAQMRAAAPA
ncbi:PGN_0703 family putative restriction endonuclease [Phreatobacter sp. HK31-P]